MPQPMFLSAQAIYRIWESCCCWWYLHFVWPQPHCPPLPRPQCDLNILDNLDITGSHLENYWKNHIFTIYNLSLNVCKSVRSCMMVWWTGGGSLLVFVICVDKERIILKPFIGTVTDHYVTSLEAGDKEWDTLDIMCTLGYSAALFFKTFLFSHSNFKVAKWEIMLIIHWNWKFANL